MARIALSIADSRIINPENKKPYKIYKHSIEEMWNSPTYTEVRRQLINGEKPEMCVRCFREEDAGIRSPRTGFNEKWWTDDVVVEESEVEKEVKEEDVVVKEGEDKEKDEEKNSTTPYFERLKQMALSD